MEKGDETLMKEGFFIQDLKDLLETAIMVIGSLSYNIADQLSIPERHLHPHTYLCLVGEMLRDPVSECLPQGKGYSDLETGFILLLQWANLGI